MLQGQSSDLESLQAECVRLQSQNHHDWLCVRAYCNDESEQK